MLALVLSAAGALAEDCAVSSVTGSGDWSVGDIVTKTDEIRTGEDTRMTVDCHSGVRVVLGPNSAFQMGDLAARKDPAGALPRLLNGIVGLIFPPGTGSSVEIHTPTAVAAVRGTEWTIAHGEDGGAVFVREGSVEVSAGGEAVVLNAAEGVDIMPNGALGPVREWGRSRIAAQRALLGDSWE